MPIVVKKGNWAVPAFITVSDGWTVITPTERVHFNDLAAAFGYAVKNGACGCWERGWSTVATYGKNRRYMQYTQCEAATAPIALNLQTTTTTGT